MLEDNLCGLSILYWFLNTLLIYCKMSVVWLDAQMRWKVNQNVFTRVLGKQRS